MPIQDFEVLSKLGAGAFGTVFKVRRKEDGKIYAMKRVDISKLSPKEVDDALTEVRILASVRHRNVVSFLEAFVERARELIMVLDFCDAGDLSQQIDLHRNQRRYLPEARIWHYLIQLVDGLDCLHALRIVHRDVKPANAFLTAAGDVRLGDLNVSKVAKDGLLRTQIGTPYFMAPEIWADKPYSESCDVWSLGCVAYELCALKPPFNSRSIAGLGRAVRSGVYDPLSRSFSPPLRDLVASLLTVRPASRPTCAFLAKS
ncbi:kinase-like domain-containing protein, partial [Pelagophyceae sp. CCMP2097]